MGAGIIGLPFFFWIAECLDLGFLIFDPIDHIDAFAIMLFSQFFLAN